MRNISLDISKLGLVVGNVIDLQLINSVGNVMSSNAGYALDESITLDSDIFIYALQESDSINHISFYRLTLPNLLSFTFTLPSSTTDKPHDLFSLLSIGCFKGIIEIYRETSKLQDKFIEKLEIYFSGKNPHFSSAESDLVELYEYYGNEIIKTQNTIDIVRSMDEYLATI